MSLTPEQIKGRIKKLALENNVDPIVLMRMYMIERFLERLSYSKYRKNFIIKGGILVASMVGITMRSTMDIDTTVQNLNLTKEQISIIINDIAKIKLNDNIQFFINNVTTIMDNLEYPGIRIHIDSKLNNLIIPIKIDISTGDVITPHEIEYNYQLLLEKRSIQLLSYNLETMLSEKIQTILSRGVLNTRMRDFYDVNIIYYIYKNTIDFKKLALAFEKTCLIRNTKSLFLKYEDILNDIATDNNLQQLWNNYQKKYAYARKIEYNQTITTLLTLLNKMQSIKESI